MPSDEQDRPLSCILLVVGCSDIAGRETPMPPRLRTMSHFGSLFHCASHPPSVAASLLTGVYPQVHGVESASCGRFSFRGPGLAELAGELGCATVAWSRAGTVSRATGFGRGFELFSDLRPDDAAATAVERWLQDRRHDDRPFFALVWDRADTGKQGLRGSAHDILDCLCRLRIERRTALVAVSLQAVRAPLRSCVDPGPAETVVLAWTPGHTFGPHPGDVVADSTDIAATVLALLERHAPGRLAARHRCQGTPLVGGGGRTTAFAQLIDEAVGVRCHVARDRSGIFSRVESWPHSGRRLWHRFAALAGPGRGILCQVARRGTAERLVTTDAESTAARDPLRSSTYRHRLDAWLDRCAVLARQIADESSPTAEETLQGRLRALGYSG